MENNKNKKIILGVMIICVILIAIIVSFMFNTKENEILFKSSYINGAWGYRENILKIYNNGVIEEYDSDRGTKKAKISKEELNELKELSLSVKDEYQKNTDLHMFDAGQETKKIYNKKTGEWITLSKFGDNEVGDNNTEESLRILELTEELYEKYIEE